MVIPAEHPCCRIALAGLAIAVICCAVLVALLVRARRDKAHALTARRYVYGTETLRVVK